MNIVYYKLHFIIQVKLKQDDNNSICNIKSMSGWERSFTKTCLILAFWQNTELPFLCLDILDIFNVCRVVTVV